MLTSSLHLISAVRSSRFWQQLLDYPTSHFFNFTSILFLIHCSTKTPYSVSHATLLQSKTSKGALFSLSSFLLLFFSLPFCFLGPCFFLLKPLLGLFRALCRSLFHIFCLVGFSFICFVEDGGLVLRILWRVFFSFCFWQSLLFQLMNVSLAPFYIFLTMYAFLLFLFLTSGYSMFSSQS